MNKNISKIISVLMIISAIAILSIGVFGESTTGKLLNIKLLNQDPNPSRIGEINTLNFLAENLGDADIKNLQVELVPEYPFTNVDSDNIQELGNVYAFQNNQKGIFFDYKIKIDKDANSGIYDLKLRYMHDSSAWETITMPIDVSNKEYAQIYVDKSSLLPGKEENLTFTITNVGNAPLKNIVFSWVESTNTILPVKSDNAKYIKSLSAGESINLPYSVIANVGATPGLYKVDLTLNYESSANSTSHIVNTKLGLFVGGETNFDVAFSQSSAGQTSLSVANIGNMQALSVLVRIPQQQGYRVSGTNSAIIGNLDKGDYTLVSFQITQNNANTSRSGNFSRPTGQGNFSGRQAQIQSQDGLRIIIDYTDTTGQRKSVEKIVPIQFRDAAALQTGQVRTQAQTSFFSSTPFYIIFAIFALIAIYYGYKKFQKKK